MGGKDDLCTWVEASDECDELLLPFYMQADFRFVHKQSVWLPTFHENGHEYDQHLFLSRRELVGSQYLTVLFKLNLVAATVYGFMGFGKELVDGVLEENFGT